MTLPEIIKIAQRLGIESDLKETPGLILGQDEVTLLEMTRAYGIIANRGKSLRIHTIARIQDSNHCEDDGYIYSGALIYQNSQAVQSQRRIVSSEVAQTLTQMLQRVVDEGTGINASLSGTDVAGKTGTTDDRRDLWFIGYLTQFTSATMGNRNMA